MNESPRHRRLTEPRPARTALTAIGRAPARGIATGLAMIRIVQLARLSHHDAADADPFAERVPSSTLQSSGTASSH